MSTAACSESLRQLRSQACGPWPFKQSGRTCSQYRDQKPHQRSDLVRIARLAIHAAATDADAAVREQRALLWCSIDNDDSLDLDQLTWCEPLDFALET